MGNIDALGKYDGMLGVPAINFFGMDAGHRARPSTMLVWVIVLLAALAVIHLLDSRTGRAIRAVKGGTTMAEAMGVNTFRTRSPPSCSPRCWPACRAGCSRTSSAPSTPRPSVSTRASSTCSWRCWAAWATCGAPSIGSGVVKVMEDQLQVLAAQAHRHQRQLRDHRLRHRAGAGAASTRATASGPSSRRACRRSSVSSTGPMHRRCRSGPSRRTARWCST